MRAPTYLRKNKAGTFYFRMALPRKFQRLSDDIPREVRISLRTNLVSVAASRARTIWTIYQDSFVEMGKLTSEEGAELLKKILAENKAKALLSKADRKERNRKDLLEALQKQNPNATLDEEGNVVFNNPDAANVKQELKLSELIDKYVSEKDRVSGWREKTREETLSKLRLFVRIIGDMPLSELTASQIRDYKEIIQRLPANLNKIKKYRGKPITEIIEMDNVEPMALRTLGKNLEKVKSLLKWSHDQRLISENFTALLNIKLSSKPQTPRVTFTDDDLEALFFSDEMLGKCNRSLKKPYQFWVPLLALMTGARIEELCQLHVADIVRDGKIWCIDFNDNDEKKLKNEASARRIPICSLLIEIGFLRYVEHCNKIGAKRLFSELKRGRDGYSPIASKWFNGSYRKRHGVTEQGKVFHSFRHTLVSHLQNKGFPEPEVGAFVGHRIEKVTFGTYGSGYTPQALKKLAEAVDFELDKDLLKQAAIRFQPVKS